MTIKVEPPKEARDSVIHTKTVMIAIIGGVLGFINVLGAAFIVELFPEKWHKEVNKSIQIISAFGVIYGAKLGLDADGNYLAKGTRTTPKGRNGCNEGEGLYTAMLTKEQHARFKDPDCIDYIETGKPLAQLDTFTTSESTSDSIRELEQDRKFETSHKVLDIAFDDTNHRTRLKEPSSEILPHFGV